MIVSLWTQWEREIIPGFVGRCEVRNRRVSSMGDVYVEMERRVDGRQPSQFLPLRFKAMPSGLRSWNER